MKMLTEDKIYKLCKETQQETSNHLTEFELFGLMFTDFFSERAIHQLSKMKFSNLKSTDKIFPIIFRELYLNKRISMECSQSEGRGISPVLD